MDQIPSVTDYCKAKYLNKYLRLITQSSFEKISEFSFWQINLKKLKMLLFHLLGKIFYPSYILQPQVKRTTYVFGSLRSSQTSTVWPNTKCKGSKITNFFTLHPKHSFVHVLNNPIAKHFLRFGTFYIVIFNLLMPEQLCYLPFQIR